MSSSSPENVPGQRFAFDRFLEAYWRDLDDGTPRTLTEYLLAFPGDDRRIAAEYLALAAAEESSADSSGAGGRSTTSLRDAVTRPTSSGGPIMNARPAEVYGPFRLMARLGQGGQGTVWKAIDMRSSTLVALKILNDRLPLAWIGFDRLHREASVMARLDHPGFCKVLDTGEVDRVGYIAMAFVEGETLASRLFGVRQSRPSRGNTLGSDRGRLVLPPRTRDEILDVVRFFEAVARTLQVAHDSGIAHRDLKTSNIMIDSRESPIVLDFGLAKAFELESEKLTVTGQFLGTPPYSSPEQIAGGRTLVDHRTDIWSFGVTLFECLTAQLPFVGATRRELFTDIWSKPPRDISSLNRHVPDGLREIVLGCLEKDLDARYSSMSDLADDLARLSSSTLAFSTLRRRKRRRLRPLAGVSDKVLVRPWIWLCAGIGVCAVIFSLATIISRMR